MHYLHRRNIPSDCIRNGYILSKAISFLCFMLWIHFLKLSYSSSSPYFTHTLLFRSQLSAIFEALSEIFNDEAHTT